MSSVLKFAVAALALSAPLVARAQDEMLGECEREKERGKERERSAGAGKEKKTKKKNPRVARLLAPAANACSRSFPAAALSFDPAIARSSSSGLRKRLPRAQPKVDFELEEEELARAQRLPLFFSFFFRNETKLSKAGKP